MSFELYPSSIILSFEKLLKYAVYGLDMRMYYYVLDPIETILKKKKKKKKNKKKTRRIRN